MKLALHAGCGNSALPESIYPRDKWQEVRLDIDASVKPDILASMTAIPVDDKSFGAIYCSHSLEHLYAHHVSEALEEFHRVLAPGGILTVLVPDIQSVALEVLKGNLTKTLYESPAGPIAAIDILWGHRRYIANGNEYYAHKTGFTADSLGEALAEAGFADIAVQQDARSFSLTAYAKRPLKTPEGPAGEPQLAGRAAA